MKNIFLVLFTISILNVNAQDKLIHQFANEMCHIISTKDLSDIKNMNDLVEGIQSSLMETISNFNKKKIKKLGVDKYEQKSIETFSITISGILSTTCEPFKKLVLRLMSQEDSDLLEIIKEQGGVEITKKFGEDKGEIIEVNKSEFLSITINDNDENLNEYYFFKEFNGALKFIEKLESYKGKEVEITYVEYKVYKPEMNSFENIKEIKSIALE